MIIASIIPLCVPSWAQREALEEGAKYSDDIGYFVTDDDYLPNFESWLPRAYNPNWEGPVLMPDMLPITSWEQNIRHKFGKDTWDSMRKHSYKAAGFRCQICGTNKERLESHELFEMVNETCTQKLVELLVLCPVCHKAHHLGIARRLNMLPAVLNQMMRLNNWTKAELDYHIEEAYEIWEQRKDMPWELDVTPLQATGYFYA